jgi:hypothetical protein
MKAILYAAIAASTISCAKPQESNIPDSLAPAEASVGATVDSMARVRQDSINRTQPGYVVDSILPPEEALRRFRADIADPPSAFVNGADSRDALVSKWVRALEANDSLTLIRMAINRPEFAFLVYPSSPNAHPPLHQPPQIAWTLLSSASVTGFRRALIKYGGKSLGFLGYDCQDPPETQGSNRIWANCRVRRLDIAGDTNAAELFGPIIERRGQFKFLSLANEM